MPWYYHADMRVDGMLWYHSKVHPTIQSYVHQVQPVIHNYGLILALAGYIVDPDVGYVSVYNNIKYKEPWKLFESYGVYAYPAIVTKALLSEVLMAALNEGLFTMRGRTRLAYPFFTKNVVLMPGSMLETLIVSKKRLPDKMVIRVGAKRNGVLQVNLKPVNVRIEERRRVTRPFNLSDVEGVEEYVILLDHEAGSIAVFGIADKALVYEVRRGSMKQVIALPIIRGASVDES